MVHIPARTFNPSGGKRLNCAFQLSRVSWVELLAGPCSRRQNFPAIRRRPEPAWPNANEDFQKDAIPSSIRLDSIDRCRSQIWLYLNVFHERTIMGLTCLFKTFSDLWIECVSSRLKSKFDGTTGITNQPTYQPAVVVEWFRWSRRR